MIKADFSPVNELFLVYPKGFKDGSQNLISFFHKLIGIIPDEIKQFIIVNNLPTGIEIKKTYPNKRIETILIDGFNELWIRDLMGYNIGSNQVCRPIYKPDYCDYLYPRQYLETIQKQVEEIYYKSTKPNLVNMPLVLDGGNLVTNGEIGFITDKIIKQNPDVKNSIKKIIFDYLGIKAIIIESNIHDKLAHSDGYMSFLNKNTLCLSQYPEIEFLKDDIEYLKRLDKIVDDQSLKKFTIYDRPIAEKVDGGGKTIDDKSNDCLNSARGIYVVVPQKVIFRLCLTNKDSKTACII